MINAPNRPICSVRSAPNAEPARPSFCLSATPKPCSSSRRDRRKGHRWRSRNPHPRSGWLARRQRSQDSHQPIAPAAAAACAGAQPPRKHLAVHATELAVQSHLQILRRYRRSLLLRLEHADRSALENHVHRTPRLGNRRSANLRVGITVSPIARAVFTLMTSSNLVGRSTGNSAGFAPLSILSTYVAVRRNRSSRFAP